MEPSNVATVGTCDNRALQVLPRKTSVRVMLSDSRNATRTNDEPLRILLQERK
jgi:hypothetical protein